MTAVPQSPSPSSHAAAPARPPLMLSLGFRPFFLLAGLHAAGALALWALWLGIHQAGGLVDAVTLAPPPFQWHAHEMLFGFATAAVAGFLLTAVPNWTGTAPIQGWRLGLLVAAWLAGRAAVWFSAGLPAPLVLAVDAAFLPLLAAMQGPAIVRAGKPRNLVFVALLLALAAANVLSHLGMMDVLDGGPQAGQRLAVGVLVVMMTVIGGRVTPAFTGNWLRARGVEPGATPAWLNAAAIATAVAWGIGDAVAAPDALRGAVAALAAVATFARLATWRGWLTAREPLLWVLHLGGLWLGLGFALNAAHLLGADAVPAGAALHAFTAGAAGTLILGVMSRATLGHTGRALTADRLLTAAFVLVALAAAFRVLAPIFAPQWYLGAMVTGGVLWVAGYGLFVVRFAPMLTAPRADGRPG
ncbi:NnrS family protein [Novispirillum sp. DQ9]|uniref:NnrS family protein n=1 Tax=Novispirillum sp. DQ9 TaxID=3398612 RepID=UPI003C7E7A09